MQVSSGVFAKRYEYNLIQAPTWLSTGCSFFGVCRLLVFRSPQSTFTALDMPDEGRSYDIVCARFHQQVSIVIDSQNSSPEIGDGDLRTPNGILYRYKDHFDSPVNLKQTRTSNLSST